MCVNQYLKEIKGTFKSESSTLITLKNDCSCFYDLFKKIINSDDPGTYYYWPWVMLLTFGTVSRLGYLIKDE